MSKSLQCTPRFLTSASQENEEKAQMWKWFHMLQTHEKAISWRERNVNIHYQASHSPVLDLLKTTRWKEILLPIHSVCAKTLVFALRDKDSDSADGFKITQRVTLNSIHTNSFNLKWEKNYPPNITEKISEEIIHNLSAWLYYWGDTDNNNDLANLSHIPTSKYSQCRSILVVS